MSDLAIYVDKDDNVLEYRSRHNMKPGDIIRISSLWLENSKGEILLARRSFKKKHDPGIWGTAAAGTLEPGEEYETNIYHEAEEEIGLRDVELKSFIKLLFMRPDETGRYVTYFKAIVDKSAQEFKIQEDEVDSVRWFTKKEIIKMIDEHPEEFVPSTHTWKKYFL